MLDEQTFRHWRSDLGFDWLSESPQKLIDDLQPCLKPREPKNEAERHCIFQAGVALMAGIRLLNNPDFLNKPHYTQTAALQLILYGCFFQLRESVEFPQVNKNTQLSTKLCDFLQDLSFSELRNALAHQGGDNGESWFYLEAQDQTIRYSTRKLRRSGLTPGKLSLIETILAADLQWVLYSRSYNIDIGTSNTST